MKNLKISLKIGLGFGTLLLLVLALGLMAMTSMKSAEKGAMRLSQEYAPEVAIASEAERNALLMMFNMRGYTYKHKPEYLDTSLKHMRALNDALAKAKEHGAKNPRLVKLNEELPKAQAKMKEYDELSNQTQTLVKAISAVRETMDSTAQELIVNARLYLKGQREDFSRDIKDWASGGTLEERLFKVNTAAELLEEVNAARVLNFKAQTLGELPLIEQGLTRFNTLSAFLDKLKPITRDPVKLKELEVVQKDIALYQQSMETLLSNLRAMQELDAKRYAIAQVVLDAVSHMTQAGVAATLKISEESDEEMEAASLRMQIGLIVAIVLGVLAAFFIARAITRPLFATVAFANNVAGGDLDGKLELRQSDEIGKLADSLRTMVATLKTRIQEANAKSDEASHAAEDATQAMRQAELAQKDAQAKRDVMLQAAARLQHVAEATSSASEQLSAQVEQSSRGAERQAQRVTETATAMEEMNATVLEVARNAAEASETSNGARQKAQNGADIVGKAVEGIGVAQRQALALKEDMEILGRQAEGIGQIMNVISDIADQTNLLALNAAIEAARAGEAGRGFAVVADEVRKLAEKTMDATKEVGDAIRAIQDGTRKNMDNVDRAVSAIEHSTKLASESGQALAEIVRLVDASSDQVHSIATASEEQSAASEEINHSIEEVSSISSETAQAMTQAAQAVAELATQSAELKALIIDMQREE
jgi:methyl-accepting chemotaxis protein